MNNRQNDRRAATTIEFVFVLMAFLIITVGMLDLAVGVFRQHLISNAARLGAREAIVRGERANASRQWGPAVIDVPLSANGIPVVDAVQPMLVGLDQDKSRVIVTWLDGGNEVGDSVQATVTTEYTPVSFFIFPLTTINLTASSTMTIAY